MKVDFIQFHPPDGRQSIQVIELSDHLLDKIMEIEKSGCRLTAEILSTGICSFCIEDPELGDFEMELVPNNVEVKGAIQNMISRFTPEKFEEWKKEML